jgi:hypothetical protein
LENLSLGGARLHGAGPVAPGTTGRLSVHGLELAVLFRCATGSDCAGVSFPTDEATRQRVETLLAGDSATAAAA